MNGNETVADDVEVTVEENETAADGDEVALDPEARFRRAMAWVTDRARAEDRTEEIMEALFAVIVNVGDDIGEDLGL